MMTVFVCVCMCVRCHSQPCALHCGVDGGWHRGLKPVGTPRAAGHQYPLVRWGLTLLAIFWYLDISTKHICNLSELQICFSEQLDQRIIRTDIQFSQKLKTFQDGLDFLLLTFITFIPQNIILLISIPFIGKFPFHKSLNIIWKGEDVGLWMDS